MHNSTDPLQTCAIPSPPSTHTTTQQTQTPALLGVVPTIAGLALFSPGCQLFRGDVNSRCVRALPVLCSVSPLATRDGEQLHRTCTPNHTGTCNQTPITHHQVRWASQMHVQNGLRIDKTAAHAPSTCPLRSPLALKRTPFQNRPRGRGKAFL